MVIVLIYNFRIVSARRDSVSAGRDLLFQFDKSQNLSFSIVFGFETIIFDKFIIYYRFLSFYYSFLSNLSFKMKTMTINLSKIIILLFF